MRSLGRCLVLLLVGTLTWGPSIASTADELPKPKILKPIEIKTIQEAESLDQEVHAVKVGYPHGKRVEFLGIMKILKDRKHVTQLTLHIPNSSHVKDEDLRVIEYMSHVKCLVLFDARDWKSPEIFESISAMENSEYLKCDFF